MAKKLTDLQKSEIGMIKSEVVYKKVIRKNYTILKIQYEEYSWIEEYYDTDGKLIQY